VASALGRRCCGRSPVRRAWGEGNSAQRQENDEGQDAARQTQLLSSASRAPSDASYKTIFMSDVELCTIRRERTRCIWRKTREIWKMAPEETALSIACGFRIVNDSMEEPHPETRRSAFSCFQTSKCAWGGTPGDLRFKARSAPPCFPDSHRFRRIGGTRRRARLP
jgi:hypothetical protein